MASPSSACLMSLLLAGLLILWSTPATCRDPHAEARRQMVREIAEMARDTAVETGRVRLDVRVMTAMEQVPRHRFVPSEYRRQAYANRPLPIGHGQTISQPYIVALMTDLLAIEPGHRVLELGTGSGYQAAVLAELGARVYSIEIIAALARQASASLQAAGYGQVQLRVGDGYYGWPEAAPFDAIMVTAAASHVPPPLLEQLKPGGRMVIPVGTAFLTQHLLLVQKQTDGSVTTRQILPVRFVPLTGGPRDR